MADINKALTKLDKKNPAVEDTKVDIKLSKDLEDLYKHFLIIIIIIVLTPLASRRVRGPST